MKRPAANFTALALALALAASTWTCGSSSTAPTTAPATIPSTAPNRLKLAGTWSGTESDRLGPAILTWSLTQSGDSVSGTVSMRPVNVADGSCASCHKSKDGTFTGTVSGTNLALTLFFPAGGQGDPTPACSISLVGTASNVTELAIAGTYTGSDPCEGIFDGTMAMSRKP
jgi:hypothetical protein